LMEKLPSQPGKVVKMAGVAAALKLTAAPRAIARSRNFMFFSLKD
jgi:hypothetical protein